MHPSFVSAVLLNAVTAVTTGAGVDTRRCQDFTAFIEATIVTTGGTMKIQGKAASGSWVDIDSRTISANGNTVVQFKGPFSEVRAFLSARTDGTFTVSLDGKSTF